MFLLFDFLRVRGFSRARDVVSFSPLFSFTRSVFYVSSFSDAAA